MLRIKLGLGTSSRCGTIKLYHILNEKGATICTETTQARAERWIVEYYKRNPLKQHHSSNK